MSHCGTQLILTSDAFLQELSSSTLLSLSQMTGPVILALQLASFPALMSPKNTLRPFETKLAVSKDSPSNRALATSDGGTIFHASMMLK